MLLFGQVDAESWASTSYADEELSMETYYFRFMLVVVMFTTVIVLTNLLIAMMSKRHNSVSEAAMAHYK